MGTPPSSPKCDDDVESLFDPSEAKAPLCLEKPEEREVRRVIPMMTKQNIRSTTLSISIELNRCDA